MCSNSVRRRSVSEQPNRFADAREMPHRLERRLHHHDAAVLLEDLAVNGEPPGRDRLGQFGHTEVRLGDRDGRANVVALLEIGAHHVAHDGAEGVERDDPVGVVPRREGADAVRGRRVGEVGFLQRVEHSGRHGHRSINRIRTGVGADDVALSRVGHGPDQRTAHHRVAVAPMNGNGLGAMTVRM